MLISAQESSHPSLNHFTTYYSENGLGTSRMDFIWEFVRNAEFVNLLKQNLRFNKISKMTHKALKFKKLSNITVSPWSSATMYAFTYFSCAVPGVIKYLANNNVLILSICLMSTDYLIGTVQGRRITKEHGR